MKISAVINTYNAMEHLEEVLDSLKDFDEIVVCDMESTDSTREVAQARGCKVVIFPKGEHQIPEPARNFAIQSASHPWVLHVDADEVVPEALRHYVYDFARQSGQTGLCGLSIPRKNYSFNHWMRSSYPDYQLRFFRRDLADWPPTVHSVVRIDGETSKIPESREDLALIHLSTSLYHSFEKVNHYTENEVIKRQGESVTLLKMIFAPLHRFVKTYLFKGSIRYGKVGYIQAQRNAIYKFLTLAKLFEEQNRKKMGR